jgi:hypothetical protein
MNPHEGAFVQDVNCQPDPCLTQERSILRFVVLALLFLIMFGTVILLILLADRPYGIQLSSIVGYTAAVALYTFSRNYNNMQTVPAFLSRCPSPASPAYPPTSGFSCCPLHSSDNSPQTSPEPARAVDHAKPLRRISIYRDLGRPLRLPRNRPDTQQSFTP